MLLFLGLSHRRSPLHLRERCAVPAGERAAALVGLYRHLGPVVLLSTCGRVEIYGDHPDPDAFEQKVLDWLARRAGMEATALHPYIETAREAGAVRRAVRVACGLESVIEGEDEILGQVRRAWLDAGAVGALSSPLGTAFHLAVRTGRRARRIGDPHAWTSLADSAAARVAAALAHLSTPRVLVAGTGPMGLRAARSLRERRDGALDLMLAGRTPERVAARAAELAACPLDLADVPAALTRADAAIVALRTTTTVFGIDAIAPRPSDRPLVLIDLSMPRAVDSTAALLPGVRMFNVDDLAGGEGIVTRWDAQGRERVEELVEQAVDEFMARRVHADVSGTLTALRVRAEGIRRRQLAQTLRRLPHLDDEARWMIEALSHAIVNKLLHEPTMRLKADPHGHTARQVRELFGMSD